MTVWDVEGGLITMDEKLNHVFLRDGKAIEMEVGFSFDAPACLRVFKHTHTFKYSDGFLNKKC